MSGTSFFSYVIVHNITENTPFREINWYLHKKVFLII